MNKRVVLLSLVIALSVSLVCVACSGDDDTASSSAAKSSTTKRSSTDTTPIVFNGQGNDLDAYLAVPPFTKQVVIHHHDDAHPDGLDLNGQICFDPKRPRRFVAGEDTNQQTTGHPGWGIFELRGDRIGELSTKEIGKLGDEIRIGLH